MSQTENPLPAMAKESLEAVEITPELVRQVADRVFALWQRDLQLARERWRPSPARTHRRRG